MSSQYEIPESISYNVICIKITPSNPRTLGLTATVSVPRAVGKS